MSNVSERVKKIVVEHLGVDEAKVVDTASFIDDLGADSLDIVELIMALEEEYDIEITSLKKQNVLSTKVKKMSITSIIFSLLFIATGIFLLLKPETAINIICYVLGVILVLWGVVSIIQFFSDKSSDSYLSISFIL